MTYKNNQDIIFVTGASRSGTTLMSLILNNHSQIHGLKETHYYGEWCLPKMADQYLNRETVQKSAAAILARQSRGLFDKTITNDEYLKSKDIANALSIKDHTCAGIYAAVIANIARSFGKSTPCEQTPRNIFYAKDLLEIYPNAKVIHMLRDPRAVMASQKMRWQRRKLTNYKMPLIQTLRTWFNYHPFTMSKLWNKATSTALSLNGHPRFRMVKFEDLLDNPVDTMNKICKFLNVKYEKEMMNVEHVNSSYVAVKNSPLGINKTAIKSWQNALTKSEVAITEKMAGKLMIDVGYQKTGESSAPFMLVRYLLTYIAHVAGVMILNPRRAVIQIRAIIS